MLPHSLIELHEPKIETIEKPPPVQLQVDVHQPDQEHYAKQGEDKSTGVFFWFWTGINASIYAKCANNQ
jgi:hypothetical protein